MEKIKFNNVNLDVCSPPIDYWIDRLRSRSYFSYSKLCHAFWNMFVGMKRQKKIFAKIHQEDFMEECTGMVSRIPSDGDYFQGISLGAANPDLSSTEEMREAVRVNLHDKELYHGLMWKKYCLSGAVKKFIYELRKENVIFVGLPHIANVPIVWGIENYELIIVNLIDATEKRHEILDILKTKENSVIIFQCGEMLSFWFINNLHGLKKNNFLIDMGRSLDLFCNMDNVGQDTLKFFPNVAKPYWSRSEKNFHKFNAYERILIPCQSGYLQNMLAEKISVRTGYKIKEKESRESRVIIKLEIDNNMDEFRPMTCYALTNKCNEVFNMPKFEFSMNLRDLIKMI